MATVTLAQKQLAESIVNWLRDKKSEIDKTPLEEKSDKTFFWILNNFLTDLHYNIQRQKVVFCLVKREYGPFTKEFVLMRNGSPRNYISINVSTIKDAREVIKNVSEMFNSLDNWYSIFSHCSRRIEGNIYGVLEVRVKVD